MKNMKKINNFGNGDVFTLYQVQKISEIPLSSKHSKTKIFIKIIDDSKQEYFLQMLNSSKKNMKKYNVDDLHKYFYTLKKDDYNNLNSDESYVNCAAIITLLNPIDIKRVTWTGKLNNEDAFNILMLHNQAKQDGQVLEYIDITFKKPKTKHKQGEKMINTVPEYEYNAEYIKKVMEYSKDDIIQGIENFGVEDQLINLCEHIVGDLLQEDEQIIGWFKYLSVEDPMLHEKINENTDIFDYFEIVGKELRLIIGEEYWDKFGQLRDNEQDYSR